MRTADRRDHRVCEQDCSLKQAVLLLHSLSELLIMPVCSHIVGLQVILIAADVCLRDYICWLYYHYHRWDDVHAQVKQL